MGRLSRSDAIIKNAKLCEKRAAKKGHTPREDVSDADALRAALAAHKRCYEKSLLLSGRFDSAEAMHDAVKAWLDAKGLPFVTNNPENYKARQTSGWKPFLTDNCGNVIKHRYDTIMELMRLGWSDEDICAKIKGLADAPRGSVGAPAIRVYRLAFEGRNCIIYTEGYSNPGREDINNALKRLAKQVIRAEEQAWDY